MLPFLGAVALFVSVLPRSLFLLGSVRLRSPTSVCWCAAKLLPRLVSFVSTKFRLQWTYQG